MAIAWLLPRFIQCQTQDQVEALYNNLLNGQNKNMRPAVNHAYPTDVNVSFELFQILDVDEVMGKLTISGLLKMEWYDHRMRWNPIDYGGVFTINVPSFATWKPDLVLTEPIDNAFAFGYMQNWVNVRYLYDVLYLKRRPTFVIVNVVLPIFFMSVLNVLVFFLPASSGERVSFAITVLLAIAFFMTIVNDTLPKSSNPIPTICYLLLGSLVLSTFIVMMTIFNLRIYHRPAEQPLSKMYLAIAFSARRCRRRSFRCQSKRIKADAVTEIDLSKENAITNRRASDEDAIKWSSAHNNKRRADDATASAYEDYADLEDVNWKTVSEALDSIGIVISTVWVVSLTIAIIVMVTAYS
ncbi:acetylcholine receptor subunit alpha-like [Dreissena polymorpha]|uniref:acetylcholine receptor subunit alpha-like n=1 Tax=Dreissena polymorpha TaxID=45954 RepID=UPI002264E7D7|nr:acetylcholine receptor subunit alpha-like [Dreissena polymorpha]